MIAAALLICAVVSAASALPYPLVPRVNLSLAGPEVSRIALGTLHLGQDPKVRSIDDARKVLEAAVAAGITTFDLADNYAAGKCLKWFGAALKLLERDQPGWRKNIQVIAKIGELDNGDYTPGGPLPWMDTGDAYTKNITNYYLDVLGTDYLDVLVYHWPDRLMVPQQVASTFRDLQSKVRYFGVSNFNPLQFKLLAAALKPMGIPLVTNEVAVSPWTPQTLDDGTMEQAMLGSRGDGSDPIRPLAWGPLGGDPSGGINYIFKKTWPDPSPERTRQLNIREMLRQVAVELNATEDVVCLAWTLRHPAGIVPIIGSMNLKRVALQAGAAIQVADRMSRQQWWAIADVSGVKTWGGPVPFVPPTTSTNTGSP